MFVLPSSTSSPASLCPAELFVFHTPVYGMWWSWTRSLQVPLHSGDCDGAVSTEMGSSAHLSASSLPPAQLSCRQWEQKSPSKSADLGSLRLQHCKSHILYKDFQDSPSFTSACLRMLSGGVGEQLSMTETHSSGCLCFSSPPAGCWLPRGIRGHESKIS